MTCLVPNCKHPQRPGIAFCRFHRRGMAHWRYDEELGLSRFCTGCNEWFPAEPSNDAEGRPVVFFFTRETRCRACILEKNAFNVRASRARAAAA